MNRIKILIVYFLGILFLTYNVQNVSGQDNTMYFMEIHPQSNLLNPAYQYNYSVFIISPSTNSFLENSSFKLVDLLEKRKVGTNSEYYWDFENIEKKLHDKNIVNAKISFYPLFVGFKLNNDWYTSFSAGLINNSYLQFPKTIVDLRKGNADLTTLKPRTIDLNHYAINELSYGEFSFGVSKKFGEKLFLGTHVKLLLGISAIKTNRFLAEIETTDDFATTLLKTDIKMDISGTILNSDKVENVLEFNKKFDDFLLGKGSVSAKNFGTAIDIGFRYNVNKKLSYFGTINDLGVIRWRAEPQQVVSNSEYAFNGFYFSNQIINKDFVFTEYLKTYTDTIVSKILPTTENSEFKTRLFVKTYFGANYQFSSKYSISALLKSTRYYDKRLLKSTLGFNWTPNKVVAFTGTFSYNNYANSFLGLGALVNFKRIQLYAVSDNVNLFNLRSSNALYIAGGLNLRIFPKNVFAKVKKL